jgi:hypothetical protein
MLTLREHFQGGHSGVIASSERRQEYSGRPHWVAVSNNEMQESGKSQSKSQNFLPIPSFGKVRPQFASSVSRAYHRRPEKIACTSQAKGRSADPCRRNVGHVPPYNTSVRSLAINNCRGHDSTRSGRGGTLAAEGPRCRGSGAVGGYRSRVPGGAKRRAPALVEEIPRAVSIPAPHPQSMGWAARTLRVASNHGPSEEHRR